MEKYILGVTTLDGGLGYGISSSLTDKIIITIPTKIKGITKVKKIDAGTSTAIALLENDRVLGWGVNTYGQVGVITSNNYTLSPERNIYLNNIENIIKFTQYRK